MINVLILTVIVLLLSLLDFVRIVIIGNREPSILPYLSTIFHITLFAAVLVLMIENIEVTI